MAKSLEEQLFDACVAGQIKVIKQLLLNPNLDPNASNPSDLSRTPLHNACKDGHLEIVKLLLSNPRIDVNKGDKYDITPLYIACEYEHVEIVKLLLSYEGVEINKVDQYIWTPFFVACKSGHFEIVKLLLSDERVDIQKDDKHQRTPFFVACQYGFIEVVKLMLSDERFDGNRLNAPFYKACERGHIQVVKYLLASGREIDLNTKNRDGKYLMERLREKRVWEGMEDMETKRMKNINIISIINIIELLESFEKNPDLQRKELRKEFGLPEEYTVEEKNVIFRQSIACGEDEQNLSLLENATSFLGVKPSYFFPENATSRDQITHLSFKHANLDPIQLSFENFQNLIHLDLSRNGLTQFPDQIGKLMNLEYLDISDNKIEIIPSEIKLLIKLISLNISVNKVKSIPSEIGSLVNLISLNILLNQIFEVPNQIGKLINLKCFNISSNEIRTLQPEIFENLSNLTDLNISFNQISEIPIEIKTLTSLRHLNISKNTIETIPPEIENLINLTDFNFSSNKISTIPSQIEKLTSLKILRGEKNQIKEFPNFLSKLFKLQEIYLDDNHLTNQGNQISQFIQSSNLIQTLSLFFNPFTSQDVDPIVQTLITSDKKNLKSLKIHPLRKSDIPIQLSTTKGLETLPIEIQSKSSQEIIDYILDLLQATQQIYRSKLMVVGYERIGKTTLLDCLLPLTGYLHYGNDQKTKYWFKLQGKYIHRFQDESENELIDEIVLENKQWKLNILSNEKKNIGDKESEDYCYGFKLIRGIKPKREIEYYCKNEEERGKWIEKLNRLIENKSTHGIDIQNHKIKPKGKEIELDISVWDFAGQHEYYNNHHYFLSARSVFLVCWRIDEGEKGLDGLKFWLNSLKLHLSNSNLDKNTKKPLFSIFIIGTHLDHYSVNQDEQSIKERREKIQKILNLDVKFEIKIEIIEVSSMNLENIEDLQVKIWDTISNHSYMGEKVPVSYLTIQDEIQKLKQDFSKNEIEFPITELTKFQERLKGDVDSNLIERALRLLTMWGECGYFEDLSKTLVYEVKFLTKQVMSQLFRPEHKEYFKHGILEHQNLEKIWRHYPIKQIERLFELMEKFDVCFKIDDYQKEKNIEWRNTLIHEQEKNDNQKRKQKRKQKQKQKQKQIQNQNQNQNQIQNQNGNKDPKNNFKRKIIIIPSYLEMKTSDEIEEYFPKECPYWMIEKSRTLKFEVIPQELISRILVKVQSMSQYHLIWRNGIYFDEGSQLKCLLIGSVELNQLEIRIRGINFQTIKNFIKKIINLINDSLKKYSGVSCKEGLISTQTQNFVLIEEIKKYLYIPVKKRKKDQIELLNRSCLLQSREEKEKENNEWWTWRGVDKWKVVETELTAYRKIQITSNEIEYYGKLVYLSIKMGFNIKDIKQVFAIDNSELRKAFSIYRKNTLAKQKESPDLFKKDDWKSLSNSTQRQKFYNYLIELQNKFEWNLSSNQLPVIPVFQGIRRDAVNKICNQGFGIANKEEDQGFYGKGMYFTTSLDYAMKYSQDKVFILSLLILGNSFPVIEHPFATSKNGDVIWESLPQKVESQTVKSKQNQSELEPKPNKFGFYGKPLQQGYQSHFTLVDGKDINTAFPITNQIDSETRDEFVVFQDAQVLPLFVLSKQDNLFT